MDTYRLKTSENMQSVWFATDIIKILNISNKSSIGVTSRQKVQGGFLLIIVKSISKQ